jgi:hypothetical protein
VLNIATLVIVLLIAGAATYVRGQVLEKELTARVALATQQIGQGNRPAADSMDMSAATVRLPDSDSASNDGADKKAVADEAALDRHGGWATFIILAFIFVFLQILGVIFGFKWGFAGKESARAFRDTGSGRYSSYAAVREHYRRVADTAQARLAVLQQRIMKSNGVDGTIGAHLKKTFRDYMQESRLQDEADRLDERRHAAAVAAQAATPLTLPTVQAASATASAPALPVLELDGLMIRLKALGEDKQAKLDLLDSLPDELRKQVIEALRQQKADAERKQRDAEVEGLL